ncbi:MAG: hydantoin utilization protein A [Alphaproteobacteria bacterium]|nr:hydantoin utilization protein A [Alphaproteobacteria bacterium]
MLVPLLSGLAAGSVHVVTGPDHLAAVAPLAAHDPVRAARTGAAWGLGHGLGVVVLGGLGMAARELVDVHALSGWSEFAVGFLLIGLGLWGVRSGLGMRVHSHGHDHDGDDHEHPHLHLPGKDHGPQAHVGHTHAAFGVGMFHGAAGMGHLLGVVPALALPPAQSALYLAAYLLAAVLSMSLFGLALGGIARRLGRKALRGMVVASGAFSVLVGGIWLATTFPGA